MTLLQGVREIQERFDVNAIFARRVYELADKKNLLEDSARIIKQKPRPFVKWVGGKRQLLAQFKKLNLYPPENFDVNTGSYFEPFVGGGAVFFDLLPKTGFLSDLNEELVIAYQVIKEEVEKLIHSLEKHKIDKEYFLEMRSRDFKKLDRVEIASRFIFLNRTCFNGLYRVNKKGGFNVPYGKYENPLICDSLNLRRVSEALSGVEIKYQDYRQVEAKARSGDFIYFDPPYFPLSKTSSFTSYTAEVFLQKEQTELRDLFLSLAKKGCFVMLSNSDSPFINEIYSGLDGVYIHKVEAGRAINSKATGRGKITEVVVTNY